MLSLEDFWATVPEKTFQAQVMREAKEANWHAYHVYDSRKTEPGWPDFFAVRGCRVVVAELKRATGVVSEAQKEWLAAFVSSGKAEVYVWTPLLWDEVRAVLR